MRGSSAVISPEQRAAKLPVWVRARGYTEEAITCLAGLMRNSESDVVRLTAADKLLDRAWGKAPVIVAGDDTRPITVDVRSYDNETLKALEATLMKVLAPHVAAELTSPLPSPSPPSEARGHADAEDATQSQTGAVSGDRIVPATCDPATSDADKERTNSEPDAVSDSFTVRS